MLHADGLDKLSMKPALRGRCIAHEHAKDMPCAQQWEVMARVRRHCLKVWR